jgi:hypothetical protein
MSACGCKGHYHNGGCSDQNVIFWLDIDGKLPKAGIPVNPTPEEISAQQAIIKQRLKLPESARIVIPSRLHEADEPGTLDGSCDWPHLVLPP